jgi:hypothetical protein
MVAPTTDPVPPEPAAGAGVSPYATGSVMPPSAVNPVARKRSRRWLLLAVLGATVLIAGAATAVYLGSHGPRGVDYGGRLPSGGAAGSDGSGVSASSGPGASGAPGSGASAGAGGAETTVRYSFDGGVSGAVADEARRLPLRASTAAGGALGTEPHGTGLAVRFPATCAVYGDKSCPRAILETGPAEVLNPGRRPLRYGAAVRMTASETAKGENVLQKGYSQGDSQFKLQIDGADGRPSCVLVGVGSPEILVLNGDSSVSDGQWHVVECRRDGSVLTITVDGVESGRRNVPAELSIVNKDPLRIGGKGTGPNNDQFHGAIDDVQVVIGA